jgi:hypothetical protein
MANAYRDYKYAVINLADASGGSTVITAVPGYEIRVVGYALSAAGAVSVTFRSNTTPLTGPMPLGAAGSGLAPNSGTDASVFETAAGEALTVLTSAAVGIFGHISYYLAKD